MTVSVTTLSSADVAAIESIHNRFPSVLLRRDFDALAAFYTEDAVLMPPHHPAVHGRAAIKAWMAGFPHVTDFKLTIDRVDGRADLAYSRGAYTMTFRPEGAPAPINDRGKFIEVLRRQSNGDWLLEADTFNSDNP